MLEILIYIIIALWTLIVLILAAIIAARVKTNREIRKFMKLSVLWEPYFFEYMSGKKEAAHNIKAIMKAKSDMKAFREFISFYLKNLTGEDIETIRALSLATGLTDYLESEIRSSKKRAAVSAMTLGLMKNETARERIESMLQSSNRYLVFAGAYTMASLGRPDDFVLTARILLKETEITYEGATELLSRFGEEVCPFITSILRTLVEWKVPPNEQLLEKSTPEGTCIAIEYGDCVEFDDFIMKSILIDLIGNFKYFHATDLLLIMLKYEENEEVVVHLLKALSKMKPEGAVSYIVPLLQSDNWVIRSQASRALGRLGSKDCADSLKPLLNDDNWWVRNYAAVSYRALADMPVYSGR